MLNPISAASQGCDLPLFSEVEQQSDHEVCLGGDALYKPLSDGGRF